MRIASPTLGALPTVFWRVVLGAAGLLVFVKALRLPVAFAGKLPATMMIGIVNSAIPFLMFSMAARILPAGHSAILNATTPLMGVAIGVVAFGEGMTGAKPAGVFIGLAGVAALTGAGPVAINPAMTTGVIECLFASARYGLAGFLARKWVTQRGGLDSRLVALGSQAGAVLVLLPFSVWNAKSDPVVWHTIGAQVWASMLILGFACTSFAYILYFRLITDVGPRRALTVTFLVPLFGVLWGWLFLGERVSSAHIVQDFAVGDHAISRVGTHLKRVLAEP